MKCQPGRDWTKGLLNIMHRIRLIGPWRLSFSESEVRLQRNFNKPTGVDDQTKFSLVWRTPIDVAPTSVRLNEQSVAFELKGGIWLVENEIILSNRNVWEILFAPQQNLAHALHKPVGNEHPYLCDAWLQIDD
jgi:hypothetical protein